MNHIPRTLLSKHNTIVKCLSLQYPHNYASISNQKYVMNDQKLMGRFLNQKSTIVSETKERPKPNIVNKIGYMLGMVSLKYSPQRLHMSGQNMFAICAEYPKIETFVEKLGLPDTFHTWFSVTTLHLWLCLVRLRIENEEGSILKEATVQLMWEDLNARMRAFNILRKRHKQVLQSKVLFTGALLAYDEGLLSKSDAILASAVWRNLFSGKEDVSAQQLEMVVEYIHRNLEHLFAIPSDLFIGKGTPTFYELGETKLSRTYASERVKYCISWPEWAK